jgi:hypothetical protein
MKATPISPMNNSMYRLAVACSDLLNETEKAFPLPSMRGTPRNPKYSEVDGFRISWRDFWLAEDLGQVATEFTPDELEYTPVEDMLKLIPFIEDILFDRFWEIPKSERVEMRNLLRECAMGEFWPVLWSSDKDRPFVKRILVRYANALAELFV